MIEIIIIIGSYLLGSISFGYLLAKYWKGIDIREHGSGNIGATNVFRVLGPGPGIIAFIGDFLKGLIAATIALVIGDDLLAVFAGLAAILGHSYPLFLNFRGGKIIATGVGVIFAMDYLAGIIALVVFGIVLFFGRYVSLASILSAATLPIVLFILDSPTPFLVFGTLGASFAIYKHIPNIKRLVRGEEFKIDQKKE